MKRQGRFSEFGNGTKVFRRVADTLLSLSSVNSCVVASLGFLATECLPTTLFMLMCGWPQAHLYSEARRRHADADNLGGPIAQ